MLINGRPDATDGLFAFLVAVSIAWLLVPLTEGGATAERDRQPRERSPRGADAEAGRSGDPLRGAGRRGPCSCLGAAHQGDPGRCRADRGGGVLDDVFDLPAGLKLLGQVVAAMIPVFNGVWVSDFTLPFEWHPPRPRALPSGAPTRQRQGGPRPDGARLRGRDEHHQLHRRRRRARRGRLRDLRGHVRDHRPVARPPRGGVLAAPPPARRLASCGTGSRPRPASWATPAPTCSATCSPPWRSWAP